jgi:high-affinity Fe2+/Pb2+ permease
MNIHIALALFHIFLVAPLFFVVGYMQASTPTWVYWGMLVLGCGIFAYHLYKTFIKYMTKSMSMWINLIHVLVIAPVLIYIGYKQKESLRFSYELLMMLGFAAIGYHTLSLVRSIETLEKF